MTLRLLTLSLTLVAASAGCEGVSLPDRHRIESLRVLGVRAEPASLSPGSHTQLSVVCADGRRGGGVNPACDVEVAWFAGCDNPLRNDWKHCYERYYSWGKQLASPIVGTAPETMPSGFGFGPTFDVVASNDLLSLSLELGGQVVHYGASYVFFAVCAGQLMPRANVSDQLPVACRDRTTGRTLGQRDFVVGVTTIYGYDLIRSDNPELVAPRFDGVDLPTECDANQPCPDGFECDDQQHCVAVVAPCSKANPQTCRAHCLDLGITTESFLLRGLDGTRLPGAPVKSLWFDYFTNAGGLPDDPSGNIEPLPDEAVPVRTGCLYWQAPMAPTEHAHLWATFRDNRGGLTAWDQRFIVR